MDLDALKRDLVQDEALRLKPYRDSKGILTIGIGHNLQAKGISPAIADAIYREDVDEVMHELDVHLPWWRELDPVRQRVLANLCFNMGIATLLDFKHTLLCMESGQFAAAAEGMRASLWHRQVGDRAVRLETMMETGVEPAGGAP